MYLIYREADVVGVCHTRRGAHRARHHFLDSCTAENPNNIVRVRIVPVNHYNTLRLGYSLLQLIRAIEDYRLCRLKNKEERCRFEREEQERRFYNLY